jgi:hypothetical protein
MIVTIGTTIDTGKSARPSPPRAPWCLFLDVDGTLLDIAPTPDAVTVDASLLNLLRRLWRACDGAVAFVTGRSIAAVDALFEPLRFDGLAIAVGPRIPGEKRLAGPSDVRVWLESLLTA